MRGGKYTIYQLRGPVFGPTHYRQKRANELGASCYAEFHLNASLNPKVNYGEVILHPHASVLTDEWARMYLLELTHLGIRTTGARRSGPGSGNIARVKAPAMLLEPCFVSNPEWAAFCRTGEGVDALGKAVALSIAGLFHRGVVCLSVGHAYRRDTADWSSEERRGDGGAPVADPEDGVPEDPEYDEEAELAELQVTSCAEYLSRYQ